ncbi:MAG TPA: SDR family NAD(P)-dependent oxidoreductase, partial [Devosia sp.]|nr:SDR family NAD(P)-dependent oxidoreductase [Devosia sp.]
MARTAWIIGGGSGIGRALAQRLAAREGFTVAISGRRAEKLAETAGDNPAIRPYPLDITDASATETCLAQILADLGGIDLLVYGAVAPVRMPVGEYSLADFHKAFEANYFGFVHLAGSLVEPMTARGGGQIAVIGSLAGYYGLP